MSTVWLIGMMRDAQLASWGFLARKEHMGGGSSQRRRTTTVHTIMVREESTSLVSISGPPQPRSDDLTTLSSIQHAETITP